MAFSLTFFQLFLFPVHPWRRFLPPQIVLNLNVYFSIVRKRVGDDVAGSELAFVQRITPPYVFFPFFGLLENLPA